jgi:hypothetical protein
MAWTTPHTWTVGETITADLLNAHLGDDTAYLKTEADKQTILDVVTADTEVVNQAGEGTLYIFTVPANTIGSNGLLELELFFSALNNAIATTNSTITVKFGTTSVSTISPLYFDQSATCSIYGLVVKLKGNGATNTQWAISQLAGGYLNRVVTVGGEGTATEDSTTSKALTVTPGTASASVSFIMRSTVLRSLPAL